MAKAGFKVKALAIAVTFSLIELKMLAFIAF